MYKHRIISFICFTTTFWIVSMITTLLAYFTLSYVLSSSTPPAAAIKRERPSSSPDSALTTSVKPEHNGVSDLDTPSLSDTSRTFPTLRHQAPLHFSGTSRRIKSEPIERDHDSGLGSSLPEDAATNATLSAAWAAAQRYPTPEAEARDLQSQMQQPVTPGEAADDEEDDDEDADFIEDDLGEGASGRREGNRTNQGSGADFRGNVREDVRRRRSRLFGKGGEGGS